jgi:hypothetical protein
MRLLTYDTWRDSTHDFSRNGRYLEISAALDGLGSDCTQDVYACDFWFAAFDLVVYN